MVGVNGMVRHHKVASVWRSPSGRSKRLGGARLEEGTGYDGDLSLAEVAALHYQIEQLAAGAQLQHYVPATALIVT